MQISAFPLEMNYIVKFCDVDGFGDDCGGCGDDGDLEDLEELNLRSIYPL